MGRIIIRYLLKVSFQMLVALNVLKTKKFVIVHPAFERTVLDRIEKYQENYFRWVEDFRLPTTDNLSERGLRGIKSHMKISGQFDS